MSPDKLTPLDAHRILEIAIGTRAEMQSLPEDDGRQFLRDLFDASDTFYAIWHSGGGVHDGLCIKHGNRRRQLIGAVPVEDRRFAEAWKTMQDQAEAAPEFFHEMPARVM
jgi:hypothetical protein